MSKVAETMTAARTLPWGVPEFDPEQVAARIQDRFPGVCAWFGEYTGQWWALTRWGLIEAPGPAELVRRLEGEAWRRRSLPVPPRGVRTGPDGRMTGEPYRAGPPASPRRERAVARRRGFWQRVLGGLVAVEAR
ncbi:hypothetical protein DPM19_11710 [Actinomadura craniellae]|uniref:Uncharacterized protein n=1 Tax=Actinomadura craniellae TaxID=2231787 RepID=A0A365H8F7_9ACTN|nr:hypothetical protein [Actinomadura craniellae]RAY15361.1 hypothetical protein DPM19_11710 [Actinomadura craniellae]